MTFLLSFLLLFGVSCITATNMLVNGRSARKNMLSVWICTGAVFSSVTMLLLTEGLAEGLLPLLDSPLLPVLLLLELAGFMLTRENFHHNHGNVTAIKCALFSSLIMVPVFSVLLGPHLGMPSRLVVNYASLGEFFLCMAVVGVLLLAYFYDKVSTSGIRHWGYLLLTPVSLSLSMTLSASFIQQYNGFAVMLMASLFNGGVFLLLAWRRREHKMAQTPLSLRGYCLLGSVLLVPINVLGMSMVAAEFATLMKRLSQLLVGVAIDAFRHRRFTLSGKDACVVALLFLSGLGYYWLRQTP